MANFVTGTQQSPFLDETLGRDLAEQQALIDLRTYVKADRAEVKKITLSAAAEAANAIVVTGQVLDLDGLAITSAVEVLVRTLAVTADKGDITVTTGTERKTVNPATGENVSWITTTAAGAFVVSVANDAAEVTLIAVSSDKTLPANLRLTFA